MNADECAELIAVTIIRQVGRTPVTMDTIRASLSALKAHPPDCECDGCVAAARTKPENVMFWCRRWQR
jgi:hypothetical protein